jgi:uncharacterized cupredoxin-like copper-binding protein
MRGHVHVTLRGARLTLSMTLILLAIGGLAACSKTTAGQGTSAVSVTLYDNRITASAASFTPGMQYHFTVVNKGAVDHEMMLMPQVMGAGMASMPMDQLDHLALARTGNMTPGATKSFDYTFPSSMAGHQGEFGCYLPGHYESGMHLSITIRT